MDLMSWLLHEAENAAGAIPGDTQSQEALQQFVRFANNKLATVRFGHVVQMNDGNLVLGRANIAVQTTQDLNRPPAPQIENITLYPNTSKTIASSPSVAIFDGKSQQPGISNAGAVAIFGPESE